MANRAMRTFIIIWDREIKPFTQNRLMNALFQIPLPAMMEPPHRLIRIVVLL